MHQAGDIITQRYQITDVLGQGGVGITYVAKDLKTTEEVAIKALSLHHLNDWKILQLFEREAKTLAQLNHPAIARYIDYFEIDTPENRSFYIVQQRAPGKSFAELVAAGWRTNEREVRKIAAQVLEILIYLHNLTPPVFHRDIKPQNLIYDKQQVYLVDFGAVTNTYQNTVARGSTVVGTFGYMAPEQFRGQTVAATDLYGLGATLLFLLSHRSPAELPQERLKINFRTRVQVSEQLASWLEKMLEPDMEQRFSSAKIALLTLKRRQLGFDEDKIKNSLLASTIVLSITMAFAIYAYCYRWQVWGWVRYFPPEICYSDNPNVIIDDYLNHGGNMYSLTDREEVILNCWLQNKNLSNEAMQLIVSKMTDINKKDYYGQTALHIVNSQKSASLLVNKGADVNIRNALKQTPLHLAVIKDTESIDLVEYLIAKGADVNARDAQGKTPLYMVIELLNSLDKVNNQQIALVNYLIKHGAKINSNIQNGNALEHTLLLHQVKSVELAKVIINNGIDINTKDEYGNTALHAAVFNKNYKLVDFLTQNGADVNALNNEQKAPLYIAIDIGHPNSQYNTKIAKLLINRGASISIRHPVGNLSIVHLAASDKDFMKFLLDKGADINAKNSDGWTPLHSVIFGLNFDNKIEIPKFLIENGADVNAKTNDGETPLDLALRGYNTNLIKLFKQKGGKQNRS